MEIATVFNIERFATEDGPGIRTVVFLKGCALKCKWCANPESQLFKKQVIYNANVCVNCGKCLSICPNKCITYMEGFGYITDDNNCSYCSTCIDNCYVGARSLMGAEYTPKQLFDELMKDEPYFKMSGGGVTFSGGEPLFYADFIASVSKLLHDANIPVLIETCGYVDVKQFEIVYKYADAFFYDIKHINSERHKELTGSGNEKILHNLEWLSKEFQGDISVRYPYIPTCNDDLKDIEEFLDFVEKLKNIKEVWFLPYHRLGIPKYQGLGRAYEMGNMPSLKFKDIEFLKDYQSEYSFPIKI